MFTHRTLALAHTHAHNAFQRVSSSVLNLAWTLALAEVSLFSRHSAAAAARRQSASFLRLAASSSSSSSLLFFSDICNEKQTGYFQEGMAASEKGPTPRLRATRHPCTPCSYNMVTTSVIMTCPCHVWCSVFPCGLDCVQLTVDI